jgi:hypothetical protein
VLDTSAATSRDLSGGWHDAGDYNKYINYASVTSGAALVAVLDRPGSVGDSSRARRIGAGVELLWSAAADATDYVASRCDATGVRPCAQSSFDTPAASASIDPAPRERLVWYLVAARNACGTEPRAGATQFEANTRSAPSRRIFMVATASECS